jgi:hypothetical protein
MLTALQARYDQRGIVFFGINPGLQTDRKLVAADAHKSGLYLQMLMDDAQLVSELVGLTQVGQAGIYDLASFKLLYHGAIKTKMKRILQQILNDE